MSSFRKEKITAGHLMTSVLRWFDSEASIASIAATDQKEVDWLRIVPLLFLHVMCLGVFYFHHGIAARHCHDQLSGPYVRQAAI